MNDARAPSRSFLMPATVFVAMALCGAATYSQSLVAQSVPDYGIMLNDDGGLSFSDVDPERSAAALRAMIATLRGTHVRTLVYQVAAGSEIMHYPTKVGSVWGWRDSPDDRKPPWDVRMPAHVAAARAQLDAGRIAAEQAQSQGLLFLPGYRLNDGHFAGKPLESPLTGAFWMQHHDRLTIGRSKEHAPLGERLRMVDNLLDYSHAEVRNHRLAIIGEIIERYADVMDGLQLDALRQPFLFPASTGAQRAPLMTEFVAAVRKQLDDAGRRHGRYLPLSIRVPPTLAGCTWAGLDVRAWLDRRLVDVLVLSPSMTLALDMPVDEFVALAEPVGTKVYAAIFRRVPMNHPFSLEPKTDDYRGPPGTAASTAWPPQVRGAALNYRLLGAAGYELYNFNLPLATWGRDDAAALAEPLAGDRVYTITQSYSRDREGLVEDRKQLSVQLKRGEPLELKLLVGESPKSGVAALRLGLRNLDPQADLVVELNGRTIHSGPLGAALLPVENPKKITSQNDPPRVTMYAQFRLADATIIRAGRNQLTLRLRSAAVRPTGKPLVVEVQLALFDP